MPVYDRGYTNWEPSHDRAWPAWWVIARRGIAEPLKKRWLLFMLFFAWGPAIGKGVFIYVKLKAGDLADLLGGGWTSIEPAGFLEFLGWQHFAVFALLAVVGADLIAADRRDNGMSLDFSRPLGLRDYLLGKALVLVSFYSLVTLVPALVLAVFTYLIAPEASGMSTLLLIPARLILYCLLTGTSMALVLLAFSAVGKRPIYVMIWWSVMVMGSKTLAAIARGLHRDSLQVVDFMGQYANAGTPLFGAAPKFAVAWPVSLLAVVAWTALAVWVLRRRIRPVEVVS